MDHTMFFRHENLCQCDRNCIHVCLLQWLPFFLNVTLIGSLTHHGSQGSSCFHAFKIISGNIQVICITWSVPDLYLQPLPDRNPRVTRQDLNPKFQSSQYNPDKSKLWGFLNMHLSLHILSDESQKLEKFTKTHAFIYWVIMLFAVKN